MTYLLKVSLLVFSFTFTLTAQNFWQLIGPPIVLFDNLIVSPEGNIFCISDTYLLKSNDKGLTWDTLSSDLTGISLIESNDNIILLTDYNNIPFVKSTDEGATWITIKKIATLIKTKPQGDIFIETGTLGGSYSYRSTDDGETWVKIGVADSWLRDVTTNINGVTLAIYKENQLGTTNLLYRSTNNGDDWTQITNAPDGISRIFTTRNGYFFALKGNTLYSSTDDGLSWYVHTDPSYIGPFDLKYLIEDDSTNLYMSVSYPRGVLKSSDMGMSWHSINSGLTELTPYKLIIDHQKYLYCNTGWGVFRSIDQVTPVELISFIASFYGSSVQLNWTTATETNNIGFEILRFAQNDNEWGTIGFIPGSGTTTEPKSYSFTDDNVSSGVYKYRLKQIDYDGTFEYSNEVEIEVNLLPKEFILYQNYPNPFNPKTKIKFSVPKQTQLKINLYNVLGELVQTITDGLYEAGSYEAELNAEALPSGIYIYKLDSGEFVQSKKIILIK